MSKCNPREAGVSQGRKESKYDGVSSWAGPWGSVTTDSVVSGVHLSKVCINCFISGQFLSAMEEEKCIYQLVPPICEKYIHCIGHSFPLQFQIASMWEPNGFPHCWQSITTRKAPRQEVRGSVIDIYSSFLEMAEWYFIEWMYYHLLQWYPNNNSFADNKQERMRWA